MNRRSLFKLGLLGTAAMALGGLALLGTQQPRVDGRFTEQAADMWRAVGAAVLGPFWPAPGADQAEQVAEWLLALERTVAGLPPALQAEVEQLSAVLISLPGRRLLAGLDSDWVQASSAAMALALGQMQTSSLAVRQQAFHALRDLSNAAYFSDARHWPALGYPGPVKV